MDSLFKEINHFYWVHVTRWAQIKMHTKNDFERAPSSLPPDLIARAPPSQRDTDTLERKGAEWSISLDLIGLPFHQVFPSCCISIWKYSLLLFLEILWKYFTLEFCSFWIFHCHPFCKFDCHKLALYLLWNLKILLGRLENLCTVPFTCNTLQFSESKI